MWDFKYENKKYLIGNLNQEMVNVHLVSDVSCLISHLMDMRFKNVLWRDYYIYYAYGDVSPQVKGI